MLVSIIVPVYNVEPYIDRCIQSLINQTYKDLQIILVDDESIDNSGNICDEYANQDSRITVIHQKHKGVSEARNTGLNIAKGEYIGFIDSDDWCEPNYYEVLLDTILRTGTDVVRCNYRAIFDDRIYVRIKEPLENSILSGREAIIDTIYNKSNSGFNRAIWNSLFKSSIINTPKRIVFNPKMNYGEDWDWLVRVLFRCKSVSFTLDCCYNYDKRNIFSTTLNSNFLDDVRSTEKIIIFLKHYDFPATDINYLKEKQINKLLDGLYEEIKSYISEEKGPTNEIKNISVLKDILFSGRMNLGILKYSVVVTMIKLKVSPKLVGKIWRLGT